MAINVSSENAALGQQSVRRWLVATALAVVATIAVGGGTRLTESGLSITEWKPVTGVFPPTTDDAWAVAFEQYRQIPEARTVHAGITLTQFKGLYWWEWAHRIVARGVGLIVALPFFWLWWRRRIPPDLLLRLALLPLLIAAQGALGWYMVQSGLSERTSVSPYRLVAHLSLALVILGIAVVTAAALWPRSGLALVPRAAGSARKVLIALTALVSLTILSGGFVAGLDAGRIFNEFPLMGGQVVPAGYTAVDGWRNMFENPIAAQFNHRLLAMVAVVGTWIAWWRAERGRWPAAIHRWLRVAAAVAALQFVLGVTTLLLVVPVLFGIAHQMGAVALLTTLLIGTTRTLPPRPS